MRTLMHAGTPLPRKTRARLGGRALLAFRVAALGCWGVAALLAAELGEPTPIRVNSEIVHPQILQRVEPEYPPMARAMRVEGVVQLDAVISARGEVIAVRRVEGHPVLSRAAAVALRRWRFSPIRIRGAATRVVSRFSFTFSPE